jgi:uncharacterized protein (TIGR00369 family)
MTEPADLSEAMNALPPGWDHAMGLRFTRATADEVIAEFVVGPQHRQAYGIVHGGVYCGVIETVASIGAAIVAGPRGQRVVGLENSSTFLHAVREGTLRVIATPMTRGRKTQVWEGKVVDAGDKLIASGRVRLLCLEPDAPLGR